MKRYCKPFGAFFGLSGLLAVGALAATLGGVTPASAASVGGCTGTFAGTFGGASFFTGDPGDAIGAIEIDDGTQNLLACYDGISAGTAVQNTAVKAYLASLGAGSVDYLGGSPGRAGGIGTVTQSSGNGGLSGAWTFNPGASSDVVEFLVIHAGGGTEFDLYSINAPGLSGVWDTSESFNKDGHQRALSFLDLYGRSEGVPEPASLALLGLGLAGAALIRRRKAG